MNSDEIIERLKKLLAYTQELASLRDPALEGDIQIMLAILVDKLRYIDPTGSYAHQSEYE
jgi:hypothetical protein